MAYKDITRAWLGEDTNIIDEIAGCCIAAANSILVESDQTANHANRVVWANKVRANPRTEAQAFIVDICSNATIAASLPEIVSADFNFVVINAIDNYATGE